MADDFAYLNARVRVRRGTLLKESFFQEALDLSFADFLRLLSETVYGGELAGQGLPDVDRAVLRTQAKLVGDLPRLVTGEAREAVRSVEPAARAEAERPPQPPGPPPGQGHGPPL